MPMDGESATRTRFSGLDEVDALFMLRDRFDGLRCAIRGAALASEADRRGLLQLAEDVAKSLDDLCASASPEGGTGVPTPARRRQKP